MSSRPSEHRRRDRSWEREDRDRYSRSGRSGASRNTYDESRRRSSRSRSPRRGDRDRRPSDRRERDDDRRDKDRDWNRDRERDRRDERGGRRRDDDHDRDRDRRDDKRDFSRKERNQDSSYRPRDEDVHPSQPLKAPLKAPMSTNVADTASKPVTSRPNLDPDAPDEEEGEAMDAENEDDTAMMASMGLTGFGSTKGKAVEGNQDGGVFLKKQRTWRQYMNRRGGFNRPLDKIK